MWSRLKVFMSVCIVHRTRQDFHPTGSRSSCRHLHICVNRICTTYTNSITVYYKDVYTSTTDWEKPEAATLGNFMRAYISSVACRHENVNLPCSSEIFHLNVVAISRTCKFSYLVKYGNWPFYLCVKRPIGHKIAKFF